MFGGFPESKRPHGGFTAEVGKRYQFEVEITSTHARYSIDGAEYASCVYEEGKVPTTGHVGFGIYSDKEHKNIENVVVSRLIFPGMGLDTPQGKDKPEEELKVQGMF